TEVELPRGSSGSQFGSREQRHGSPVVGETGKGVPATDGWDDPLAKGRPKELAMLTSAEFAARLAAGGCVLGRLAEWRQAAALPSWRKAG
ncbi:MAG: hypothetical protein ACKOJF_32100, partial [Planctomycetaceae bacterium]